MGLGRSWLMRSRFLFEHEDCRKLPYLQSKMLASSDGDLNREKAAIFKKWNLLNDSRRGKVRKVLLSFAHC